MTITEFILARVAEDEAGALDALEDTWDPVESKDAWWAYEWSTPAGPNAWPTVEAHVRRFRPTRVLAECAAKRRIVVEHRPANLEADGTVVDFSSPEEADFCFGCGANFVEEGWSTKLEECPTLRALAAVYAAHPDYDESWTL